MILLTGADGYMGWPVFLKLGKTFKNELIIGVDNLQRRKWVENVGGISAVPVYDIQTRIKTAKEKGFENIHFIEGDISNKDFAYQLLAQFKPRAIVRPFGRPTERPLLANQRTARFFHARKQQRHAPQFIVGHERARP